MSEAPEVNFDAVEKPKKTAKKTVKKRRSAKKRAAPKPREGAPARAKSDVPFPGLTRTVCADACSEKGCVISGTIICGHPTKGAQVNQGDKAALKRLQTAREQLAVKIDPNRFRD